MVATGTIVAAWKDNVSGYLAVRVAGDGSKAIEYIGNTGLLDEAGEAKSNAVLKAECVVSVKARREAQLARPVELPVTGTVPL